MFTSIVLISLAMGNAKIKLHEDTIKKHQKSQQDFSEKLQKILVKNCKEEGEHLYKLQMKKSIKKLDMIGVRC